jgi:branched-subunit amino acid aminotransferase/4-amino-4-deoxychorismate lyase
MRRIVYLSGSYVHLHDASVSVFDAGFQFGAGLFETVLCIDGTPHVLRRHLERLRGSAEQFGIPIIENDEEIRQAIGTVLTKNSLDRGHVRLKIMATPGDITAYQPIRRPTMFITDEPYLRPSLSVPWRLGLDGRVQGGPLTAHKSSSYLAARMALHTARMHGFDDMVLLDRHGNVAETSIAGMLLLYRGRWIVPETVDALPSISRDILIELLRKRGEDIVTRVVYPARLEQSAVLLSNSLLGPFPVQSVNKVKLKTLPQGLAEELRDQWLTYESDQ